MPKISIILPTFNRESTLLRAVQSVLSQTYQDFELIIVNDGSTDGTSRLLQTLNDNRISILSLKENEGVASARNKGMEVARGEWIAFQDSDDEWLEKKLESQLSCAATAPDDVRMVLAGYIARTAAGCFHVFPRQTLEGLNPIQDALDGWPIITPTWLVHRSLIEELGGFDKTLPCFEDWDLVFRIMENCKVSAVQGPVLIKHQSKNSVFADKKGVHKALGEIIRRHGHHWKGNRRKLARRYTHLACISYDLQLDSQARSYLIHAVKLSPLALPTISLFVSMIMGNSFFRIARRLWPRYTEMAL